MNKRRKRVLDGENGSFEPDTKKARTEEISILDVLPSEILELMLFSVYISDIINYCDVPRTRINRTKIPLVCRKWRDIYNRDGGEKRWSIFRPHSHEMSGLFVFGSVMTAIEHGLDNISGIGTHIFKDLKTGEKVDNLFLGCEKDHFSLCYVQDDHYTKYKIPESIRKITYNAHNIGSIELRSPKTKHREARAMGRYIYALYDPRCIVLTDVRVSFRVPRDNIWRRDVSTSTVKDVKKATMSTILDVLSSGVTTEGGSMKPIPYIRDLQEEFDFLVHISHRFTKIGRAHV